MNNRKSKIIYKICNIEFKYSYIKKKNDSKRVIYYNILIIKYYLLIKGCKYINKVC